jgi:hypothetical protein
VGRPPPSSNQSCGSPALASCAARWLDTATTRTRLATSSSGSRRRGTGGGNGAHLAAGRAVEVVRLASLRNSDGPDLGGRRRVGRQPVGVAHFSACRPRSRGARAAPRGNSAPGPRVWEVNAAALQPSSSQPPSAACPRSGWRRRIAGAPAGAAPPGPDAQRQAPVQAPAPHAVQPPDPRGRAAQLRRVGLPPRARRVADRRRERAVGRVVPDARELRRRCPDPATERPQRPLRTRRARIAFLAAMAAVERVKGASRGRHPLRQRARRHGVAVRVHVHGDDGPRAPPRERLRHDPRPRLLPRRPSRARRRLRGAAGAKPRPQRVRAVAPVCRLDVDRAVLGPHRASGAARARRHRGG